MHALFVVLFPIFFASAVLGHGYVHQVTIAGKGYRGNPPAESGQRGASAVRQIANTNPVKGVNNPDLVCGASATAGSLVADANPGDTVSFDWRGAGLSSWPHNTGPILTYMASCGSTTCDKFNPSNAQWFKISQLGQKSNGQWYMADVRNGQPVQVQIPSTLAPGNYLIRQEIIALHIGMSMGGVEFYPSCTQLRVGGNQSGRPAASDLVSIPGAYRQDHPGLFVPNIFEPGFKYSFPGPAIARIANGGAAPAPAPAPPTTTTKARPTSSTSTRMSTVVRPSSTAAAPSVTRAPNVPPSSAAASAPAATATKVCRRRKRSQRRMVSPADAASPSPSSSAAVPASVPTNPSRIYARHAHRAMRRLEHASHREFGH